MFWKTPKEYWEIYPKCTQEKIENKKEEYSIELPQDEYSNRWATFAIICGLEQGLDIIEANSMASIVSGIMGGLIVSAGTDN